MEVDRALSWGVVRVCNGQDRHEIAGGHGKLPRTRQLADPQLREDGIRLYGVAPGTVFTDGVRGEMSPAALQETLRTLGGLLDDAGVLVLWMVWGGALAGVLLKMCWPTAPR